MSDSVHERASLEVARSWAGAAADAEPTQLTLQRRGDDVLLQIDAPHEGDPLPGLPPGRCPALWDYEVVELFLLGADEQYLELEFGPGGHYLALQLRGPRRLVTDAIALAPRFALQGRRWRCCCTLPAELLPQGLSHCNAYRIHGTGSERRYLAAFPLTGDRPDFHRLEYFRPIPWQSRPAR